MDEYRSRLLRINDRENHIFMEALLAHMNEDKVIDGLAPEQRREVLELLITNAELFERGSAQYHSTLHVSEKYLEAIENSQQAYSLIQMCVVSEQSGV